MSINEILDGNGKIVSNYINMDSIIVPLVNVENLVSNLNLLQGEINDLVLTSVVAPATVSLGTGPGYIYLANALEGTAGNVAINGGPNQKFVYNMPLFIPSSLTWTSSVPVSWTVAA